MDKRIAYYLKKYADYLAVHPSKRRNPYRLDRLAKYKEMFHQKYELN